MEPCNVCKKPLVDGRTVEMWQGGKCVEKLCSECDQKRRVKRFEDTGKLSTRLMMDAGMASADQRYGSRRGVSHKALLKAWEATERVQAHVKTFEKLVWFNGLQAIAKKRVRGHSLKQGDLSLLCYTMAGRAMITIEDKEASVTVITTEDGDESRMGIQGIDGTADQAIGLLVRAERIWAQGIRPVKDDNVSMGF